jgi:hypothetical protein
MIIAKCSLRKIARTVKKMFGKEALWDRKGSFVFVHLDEPARKAREDRYIHFDPTLFFDPTCPHCQPFLNDGAFMVYTPDEMVGMRVMKDGLFETVMLTPQMATVAN